MEQLTVWLADIRELAEREEQALELLTPGRRERALAFKRQEDRLHCAAAGLLLRQVLCVRCDGELSVGAQGKPVLTGGPHFNLTHGGNFAALAVFSAPVGVDLEPVRHGRKLRVPRRWLLPEEQTWLEAEHTPERFAWLWTRLEAVLKADGRGLTLTDRTGSVLSDGEGRYIRTVCHEGHYLSVCAERPFELKLVTAAAESLLTK